MNTKNIIVALIAIAIIAVGGYFFPFVQQTIGAVTPSTSTATYATESTGAPLFILGNAVTGPNSTGASGYTGYVATQGVRTTLNTASTTLCTLASPFTSTSSLSLLVVRLDTSSTSAQTIVFATSTIPAGSASSSPFFTSTAVAANAQAQLIWDAGVNNSMVPPSGSVVVTASGGTGTFSDTGICTGVFVQP